MKGSFFQRIAVRKLDRRRVFLICLLAGLLFVRAFEETGGSTRSTILVYPIPVTSAVFDPRVWRFDPSDGRELSTYSRGGQAEECSWQMGAELRRCVAARKNAREFILENWRSNKRAYVAVDFPCIDCSPVMHIFIEPDITGRWRIATVLEESRFAPRYPPNAFGVMYRRANRREVDREHVGRVLSFVDESGKELASF